MSLTRGALSAGPQLERRERPRRAADLEWYTLAAFARWFIGREPAASFILDRRLRVLLTNAAADDLLLRTRQIELRGAALNFSSKAHRSIVAEVADERTTQATFQLRVEGRPETARIEAICLGPLANDYLLLSVAGPAASLQCKIRSALQLTPAETEIALAISRGLSHGQIASARRASINTIKTQVRCIYQKAGVRSQAALASKVAQIR
jgi:DNA-binding NarL/FixJ family response regulator